MRESVEEETQQKLAEALKKEEDKKEPIIEDVKIEEIEKVEEKIIEISPNDVQTTIGKS